jgi:hypothetical protein
MVAYHLAAAAAALTLAAATPAAAKPSAGSSAACPVPAALSAPVLPLSPDGSLEDKIDQLTGVIADLSDRIAYLEDALDAPNDEDGGDSDQGLDLVHLRGAHHARVAQRALRTRQADRPAPPGNVLAASATPARPVTKVHAGTTT